MKKIFVIILTFLLVFPITIVKANDNNDLSLGSSAKSVVLMEVELSFSLTVI